MNVFKLFGEISIDKSGAIKGIKEVEGQASKSSLAMQKTFNKLAKIAKVAMIAGAVAATAAIVKMTKDSIKAFAEFEEGMNEVFTLLPDITEEAMDSMKEDVKSFAKEMGILPDEIVPALYQAISAGVPQENVFDFMTVASKAAIGGATDLETAVDGLSSIINAYGKENMTAGEAADILFTAVRLGKTTMEELSDRLFQVNPIAAALGINFGDVAAAMAEITAAGVPTRVAATQLRQMLMEMSKAGSDVATTFEHIAGESFQDFIASGGNLGDALQLLTDYAEENDIKMQDMFGSVEAGQAVLALTGTHLDSYTAKIAEMDNAAGAADAAHAKMEGGLKRTWAKIQAWWATVKINLGEKLQEPLERVITWIEDHQEDIEEGITAIFDGLIKGAEWIMDHSAMLLKALKYIGIAFGVIVGIKFAAWIWGAVAAGKALLLAIGPAGWLLLAIGTFTAAVIANWDELKESEWGEWAGIIGMPTDAQWLGWASDLWDGFLSILPSNVDWLNWGISILNGIIGGLNWMLDGLTAWMPSWMKEWFHIGELSAISIAEGIESKTGVIEAAGEAIVKSAEEIQAEVLETTQDYLGKERTLTLDNLTLIGIARKKAGDEIVADLEETHREIIVDTELAQTAISALARFGMNVRKTIIGEEREDIYSIGDAWEDFGDSLKGTFESSILQFFRMFRDNTITIGSIVTNFVDNAISEIERLAAKWTAEHVWAWLTGGAVQPLNLGSLATAWDWLAGVFSGFGGWLGIAGAAILLFSGKLDGAVAAIGNFIGELWSGITGFFGGIWDWLFGGGGGGETPAPSEEVLRGSMSSMLERIYASTNATVSRLASEIFQLQKQAGATLGTSSTAYDYLGMAARAAESGYQSRAASRLSTALGSFAEGGLFSSPVLSLIGEGPQKEAVLPLSKPVFRELGQGIIEALTSIIVPQPVAAMAGGGDVYVTIESAVIREEADIDKVATRIVELTEEERRAQGRDSLIGG